MAIVWCLNRALTANSDYKPKHAYKNVLSRIKMRSLMFSDSKECHICLAYTRKW